MQNKEQDSVVNLIAINKLITGGIDKVTAYQMVYKISYEEALQLVLKQRYEALVSTGVTPERAIELVYKNTEKKRKI